jgi:hypothetical protein
MAITATREAREVRVGFIRQTAWGTALNAGVFQEIPASIVAMDRDLKTIELTVRDGYRQPIYKDTVITTNGAAPTFKVTTPFCLYDSDWLLAGFFQSVTEAAGTPFLKTFVPFSTHPDFSVNGGYFYTWTKYFPITGTSWTAKDCICTGFKLEAARNGLLMLESDWIANGAIDMDVTPGGTWERGLKGPGGSSTAATQYGTLHFNALDIKTLALDAGSATGLVVDKISLAMQHDVTPTGPSGTGGWQTMIIHGVKGTVVIECLKDAQFEAAMASQEADGYAAVAFNWGAAGAAVEGELELVATGKLEAAPDIREESLIGGTITMNMKAASTATNMCTIKMSNAIDRTW